MQKQEFWRSFMDKGVLTGCDAEQEWMLKWWWKHYSMHNHYPVTFCDFGMSPAAREWCKTKGTLLPFDPTSLLKEKNLSAHWAKHVGKSLWNKRALWFSKAFVLPQTPYQTTLWTDIDCEVLQDTAPLFEMAQSQDGFAIAYDSEANIEDFQNKNILKKGVRGVQAGVFAYTKTSPLLSQWIDYCAKHLDTENSDQSALSHLLHATPFNITILSNKYNWLTPEHPNPHAVIQHHNSASRKRALLTSMRFHD